MAGSTYVDSEFGSLTIDAVVDAPIREIQGITVDYRLDRSGNFEEAFDSETSQATYYAYLVLTNGDTVHFWENVRARDSLAGFVQLGQPHRVLAVGHDRLFIPKHNMMLNAGKYNATLTLEARVEPLPIAGDSSERPAGKPLFWGSVPIAFTQPQLMEYVVCSTYFAVNEAVVDPYSFDWPQARPDLCYKIVKPCGEELAGAWSMTSAIDWRSTEWKFLGDSLRFMLAQGDHVSMGIYDYDRLDADDFLGNFGLDLDTLANKGRKKIPNFGQVRDLSFTWTSRPYRR